MTIALVDVARQVSIATALNQVQQWIRRFVVLSPEASTLTALWVAQTHAIDAFDFTPYLDVHSPTKECGKSRLLEALEPLVLRPWYTGRVSVAALMRKIDIEHPALLLDERDAAFNGDEAYTEALRGLLNAGFHREGRHTVCVGQGANLQARDFSVFGPKAIAGIGKLTDTVASRSIPIALKKRMKAEPIDKFRRRDAWDAATVIRDRLAAALTPHIEALRAARPTFPDGLSDRAEDVLEPLFAIADLAGETWAGAARAAAVALMGLEARAAQEADQNLALELLADIRDIFETEGNPGALATKTILAGLTALEDRPWATYTKNEKPITGHKLSRLLKGFGVVPAGTIRIDTITAKGYHFAALKDAFARYLPIKASQASQPNESGPETAKSEASHGSGVTLSKKPVFFEKPKDFTNVTLVTLSNPDHEDNGVQADDQTPPYGISLEAWQRRKGQES